MLCRVLTRLPRLARARQINRMRPKKLNLAVNFVKSGRSLFKNRSAPLAASKSLLNLKLRLHFAVKPRRCAKFAKQQVRGDEFRNDFLPVTREIFKTSCAANEGKSQRKFARVSNNATYKRKKLARKPRRK